MKANLLIVSGNKMINQIMEGSDLGNHKHYGYLQEISISYIICLLISIISVFIAFLLADTHIRIASIISVIGGSILGAAIMLKILLGKGE